jgi:hypothetical protein
MDTLLLTVGTLAGVAYAVLGVQALKHLPSATEVDRTVGWSLWWCAERDRYTQEGKRLCTHGSIAFVVALAAWLTWAIQ